MDGWVDGWIEGWVAAGFSVWIDGSRDRWVDGYMGRVDALAWEPCGNSLARLAGLSLWLAPVTSLPGHVLMNACANGTFSIVKAHLCGVSFSGLCPGLAGSLKRVSW